MLSCFVYLAVHPHRFSHSWPFLPESPDTKSLPYLVTSLLPYFPFSKSLPHNLFADPHPLTPVESYRFKNSGRRGWSRRFTPTLHKSFSCNTYGSPRKCCKQKTYDLSKSFRCNTYKKPGGTSFKLKADLSFVKPFIRSLSRYLLTSLLRAPLLARPYLRPAGEDGGGEPAARRKFAADDAPLRVNGFDDVAQNSVDGIFVKDAEAAVGEEIHFQRFELDAIFFGHVLDGDGAEVGETGLGADGGVFGKSRGDNVAGKLIRPGFERGQFCVDAGASVLFGIVGHECSSN